MVFMWSSNKCKVRAPQIWNAFSTSGVCVLYVYVCVCTCLLLLITSCAVKSPVLYHFIPLTYSTCGIPHRLMGLCSPMNCGWVWLSTAWLVSFSLTSTPLSTTQFSSILLRQPLDLDFIRNLRLALKRTREPSLLHAGTLSEHTAIKGACILEWSLMSRMWASHMIRSCYTVAWVRFRLASNYRNQKKALLFSLGGFYFKKPHLSM